MGLDLQTIPLALACVRHPEISSACVRRIFFGEGITHDPEEHKDIFDLR